MKNHILLSIFSCFSILTLFSQEKPKDTLFFKYDKKYIKTYEQIPHYYFLEDSSGISSGTFFFEELEVTSNIKPDKIFCLKKMVRSSKFYNSNRKMKLDDNGLFEYFNNYIVFLVKKNKNVNSYIRVRSNWEIE